MVSVKMEVIGGSKNFWLYSKASGYDLTHPPTPASPPIYPRIPMETTTGQITIDPSKTALVVIDLQNYFLSPLLGRPPQSVGFDVVDKLSQYAIPACRKADMPVVWLGWGLSPQDLDDMPPTIVKGLAADTNFEGPKKIGPLGSNIGPLEQEDGTVIEGGLVLMKDQWNSKFYPSLAEQAKPQDVWAYKNRLNGFWGGTGIEDDLKSRGITTLLFSGANEDQCVAGSLQDAFTKGWDCLLLSDGTGTTSPEFAKQGVEYNVAGGWGFLLTCKQFAEGVDNMQTQPGASG